MNITDFSPLPSTSKFARVELMTMGLERHPEEGWGETASMLLFGLLFGGCPGADLYSDTGYTKIPDLYKKEGFSLKQKDFLQEAVCILRSEVS